MARRKLQAAGPRFTQATTGEGTVPFPLAVPRVSPRPEQLQKQKLKHEPAVEKAERLQQLKESLKEKLHQTERKIVPSSSAPFSPPAKQRSMVPSLMVK